MVPSSVTRRPTGPDHAGGSAVVRVVDRLARRIREGQFDAGERLPTVRQLGQDFGVSPNTITAALGILESQRVVVRHQRRGIFVRQAGEPTKSMTIGLVTPQVAGFESKDSWEAHVTLGSFSELVRRGHKPELLQVSPGDGADWRVIRQTLMDRRADLRGVMITWSACSAALLKSLVDDLGAPVVQVGSSAEGCRYNFVSIDHFGAGRLAAERALHRLPGPVVVLSGPAPHDFPRRRLADGFINRLHEARPSHLRVDILTVGSQPGDGERVMLEYLAKYGPPRTVFSIGDLIAIDAMHAAQSRGFSVPEDIAFIGSAGLDACQACRPTLAHTQQPMEQLGAAAADLIEQMCRAGEVWSPGPELPVTWVAGGSLDEPAPADESGDA